MGSLSEGETSDQQSERYGIYSPSADVSESETSSGFSCRRCGGGGGRGAGAASGSVPSSPFPSVAGTSRYPPGVNVLPEIVGDGGVLLWEQKLEKIEKREPDLSEVEMMKERFAKLLLGEDMSGGGKGVCSALAISNAITNLSATVFGELWRLEPLASQKKAMWRREMGWLLCVSDSIVELVPSIQEFPGGGTFEVMLPRPRSDLHLNLPALKKLDAMLIGMLDGFKDTEFWYVDRGILLADADEDGNSAPCSSSSFGRPSVRQEEKWWLPCPRVLPNGLSEETRKKLQQCRDCANQILKASMAINSTVLADMEIPDVYYETLPKCGKSCLGDVIYRYVTADQFSPECLLDCLELSSEHHTLEIANRIEAAIHVWRQKDRKTKPLHGKLKKTKWTGKVKGLVADTEKNHILADRAEGLLQSLKLRYPGLPQTVMDMNKIQYNKDLGLSILESYSRVMESLAFNVIARIDDLIYVDDMTKKCMATEKTTLFNPVGGLPIQKRISPSPFSIKNSPYGSPFATPTICSSTPVSGSPLRAHPTLCKDTRGHIDDKSLKAVPAEVERVWSYARNLSTRKDSGDAPERD